MLVMAALASSAAAVILAIDLWLFIGGYAVGGNGVVFPVWFLVLIYGGAPSLLLGSLMWVGYLVSSRHARKRGLDQ